MKRFYKTKITQYGVQNVPTTTLAVLPDPTQSECSGGSSSDEEQIGTDLQDKNNVQYESTESEYTGESDNESSGSDKDKANDRSLAIKGKKLLFAVTSSNSRTRKRTTVAVQPTNESDNESSDDSDKENNRYLANKGKKTVTSYRMRKRTATTVAVQPTYTDESGNESSGKEDDQPLARIVSVTSANFRWRKRDPIAVQSTYTGDDLPDPPLEQLTPRQYFDQFFDPELFDVIADETNLYSVQETGKSVGTNPDEIEQFIGIIVQMGILKYPQYRMYWPPKTRSPIIANVMGLTRFENLKRFFHVTTARFQTEDRLILIDFIKCVLYLTLSYPAAKKFHKRRINQLMNRLDQLKGDRLFVSICQTNRINGELKFGHAVA